MRRSVLILLAYLWTFGVTHLGTMVVLSISILVGSMTIENAFVGASSLGLVAAAFTHVLYDFRSGMTSPATAQFELKHDWLSSPACL